MNKVVVALSIMTLFTNLNAQTMQNTKELSDRIQVIEDKMSIQNLVDTFSVLADQKETQKQTLLFTEDASVESRVNGQPEMTLTGRKQIGDAFGSYLSLFETVYHINGQHTIELKENTASATSYCMVVLIGMEDGKKMKTTMGVYYNDEFVKENNTWLITKRTSNFIWQEKEEVE